MMVFSLLLFFPVAITEDSSLLSCVLNKYILLDVLLSTITDYFFKLCHILTSLKGESKYKQLIKFSAILHNKRSNKRFIIQLAKLLSVRVNFVDIYLRGMRDRSMGSGTELAWEIQRTDWSTAGEQGKLVFVACTLRENLSNQSSGVQIPRDICTHFGRYLYSTKGSWIINFFPCRLYFSRISMRMSLTWHVYSLNQTRLIISE